MDVIRFWADSAMMKHTSIHVDLLNRVMLIYTCVLLCQAFVCVR